MPELTLQSGVNTWALASLAVLSLAAVVILYRRAFGAVRRPQWLLLVGLRSLAVWLVLLLLARPMLSFQRAFEERRAVVLLLDASASMSVADDPAGGTRFEQAVDRVTDWWRRLQQDLDVRLLVFADAVRQVATPDALSQLAADGNATSLVRALAAGRKEVAPERCEAIVLFSDGVHNMVGDPVALAGSAAAPVHTVGVGNVLRDRRGNRDLHVAGLECPTQMPVNNLNRIKAYIESVGYPGRVVQVVLREDDQQVAAQEVVVDDAEGPQEVVFEFRPEKIGLHRYVVQVPPAADEKIPQNNRRATSALVVEASLRVLYVEGTLRAESGALVGQFLAKDPNLEFCALVQNRPNVFLQRTNIEGLDLQGIPANDAAWEMFDVVVIGDLDSTHFQPAQRAAVRKRVESGGGLLLLGGYHGLGPGGYGSPEWADMLPCDLGERDVGQIDEPFPLQLTVAGQQHPIFANIRPFFATAASGPEVEGLPPLGGAVRTRGLTPSGLALAVHPTERVGDQPLPILAVRTFGQGRVAIFAADTTRNWHQELRSLEQDTPFLRFWGQTIRWLAGRTEEVTAEAGISAATDRALYTPGEPIQITALVRGEQGEAAANATVVVDVEPPGGRVESQQLPAVAGPAGRYATSLEPQQSGRYVFRVAATVGGQKLTAEPLEVEVGRPYLEFDRLDLDAGQLTAVARAANGSYTHISTADRVLDLLRRRRQSDAVQYELSLAWPPLCWSLFVGLLSVEWILRRKYRLR